MSKTTKEKDLIVLALGTRIKELRIAKGYTNYENFAFDHDLPRSQFGRYEKGEDIRFTSLIKILHAFNISPEEFFDERFSLPMGGQKASTKKVK
ncbi:MAG: helix-turn-helix transcriptional regulator [bacterium]|nr:helix-turn-helix transcriptional regulator [bacterium]